MNQLELPDEVVVFSGMLVHLLKAPDNFIKNWPHEALDKAAEFGLQLLDEVRNTRDYIPADGETSIESGGTSA